MSEALTTIPFGKYKGRDFTNRKEVPAQYLIWIDDNYEDLYGDIKDYIELNREELEEQAREEEKDYQSWLEKKKKKNRNR